MRLLYKLFRLYRNRAKFWRKRFKSIEKRCIWRNIVLNNDNQNVYVGDGNIRIYTCENDIAIKTEGIMSRHIKEFNNKDFIKKSIELFHLNLFKC